LISVPKRPDRLRLLRPEEARQARRRPTVPALAKQRPALAKHQTAPAGYGPMCATIVHSSAMRRPAALFVYSRDRAAEHAERHLQGYAGMILDVGMDSSSKIRAPAYGLSSPPNDLIGLITAPAVRDDRPFAPRRPCSSTHAIVPPSTPSAICDLPGTGNATH
jgi:hypothetical protein